MSSSQPQLQAHAPPKVSDVDDEIKARWKAEQHELAKHVIIDDAALGFALPSFQPTPAQNQPSKKGGAVSATSGTPLPPIPQGVVPCVPPMAALSADGQAFPTLPKLTTVAGIDISFVKDTDLAVASLVILAYPSLKVIHTTMRHVRMTEPYIAGFLAFREVPLIVPLIEEARRSMPPEQFPQIIFVDGNGIHHPRKLGFASHLGVVCDIPTIGCAKKLLEVDGLTKNLVNDQLVKWQEVDKKGPIMPLISPSSNTLWGFAAMTGNSTKNPVFVSPGHRVGFTSAMALTLAVTLFRVPEPIRQADLRSREYIRKHFSEAIGDVNVVSE